MGVQSLGVVSLFNTITVHCLGFGVPKNWLCTKGGFGVVDLDRDYTRKDFVVDGYSC